MIQKNVKASNNFKKDIRKSKLGYTFDINDEVWQLDNSLKINWKLAKELNINSDVFEGFKKALAVYASEVSASYVDNIYLSFRSIFRKTGDVSLKRSTIQNYLSTLDVNNEYKLGAVKGFILDWYDKGFEGITDDVASFLEELKLRGNKKGKAVAKGCPYSGAYTLQEQQAILEWAVNSFSQDQLSLKEYAWLLSNMYTGSRSIQLRSIAKADLRIEHSHNGREAYSLKLPIVKRRGLGFRDELDEIDIDEDLALLLFNQAEQVIEMFEKRFGERLDEKLKGMMPVFLNEDVLSDVSSVKELLIIVYTTPDALFMKSYQASSLMQSISHKCQARTERLHGEFIHLSSRRFRYTIGTNAARRGLGAYVIAKILGHKDIQNVKVYTENTIENVDLIDDAMSDVLAPLAQAFAGILIETEKDAIRSNDPRSRIKANDGSSVGNCGEFGFCATGGRACYLCSKFQPWVNGPHHKVLESIKNEREVLRSRGASDFVIQSTDRLYLAVTEVVEQCKDWKSKTKLEVFDNG